MLTAFYSTYKCAPDDLAGLMVETIRQDDAFFIFVRVHFIQVN